jgi:hypothetical protein
MSCCYRIFLVEEGRILLKSQQNRILARDSVWPTKKNEPQASFVTLVSGLPHLLRGSLETPIYAS